ncbi:MAG: NADH-quinone oxidoreductase subunit L, partial [Pseudomonadota bacterium]
MIFNVNQLSVIVVFCPLFAATASILCRKLKPKYAHLITCTLITIAFISALGVFNQVINEGKTVQLQLLRWVDIGNFDAFWSIYVDSLTAVMYLVVCTVSMAVH